MSSTQFVEMYHPLIPSTATDPVEVALQSVDDHAARGWLLVDPEVPPPAPSTPYYTTAAADSRFAKVDDIDDPETLTGERLRAAFGALLADDPTVVAAAEQAVSDAGPNLVRVVKGDGAGYVARPSGAASVQYAGPLVPTDLQSGDSWTDLSGAGMGV